MKKNLKLLINFFIFLIISGCDSNNGTESNIPENGTISGTITFIGEWPEDGEITVSLSPTWPPQGIPSAYDIITINDLINNTYVYIFENITFGTYGGITVAWEDPNDSNLATQKHILGASSGSYPFISQYGGVNPNPIIISESEYYLNELNITANLNIINNN